MYLIEDGRVLRRRRLGVVVAGIIANDGDKIRARGAHLTSPVHVAISDADAQHGSDFFFFFFFLNAIHDWYDEQKEIKIGASSRVL